jgi:hypothetical protein
MSTRMSEAAGARRCFAPACRGRKGEDDRRFLEASHVFTVENAAAEGFGSWNSVWKGFDRVSKAGVFEAFFDALAAMSSAAHLIPMFDVALLGEPLQFALQAADLCGLLVVTNRRLLPVSLLP